MESPVVKVQLPTLDSDSRRQIVHIARGSIRALLVGQPKPNLPPRNRAAAISGRPSASERSAQSLLRVDARGRAGRCHLLLLRYAHRRARHRALLLLREPEADGVRIRPALLGSDRLEDRRQLSRAAIRIHPKDHIAELRSLLPEKYSPLRANGDGLQSVYLAEVGPPFAAALFRLIGAKRMRSRMSRTTSIAPNA